MESKEHSRMEAMRRAMTLHYVADEAIDPADIEYLKAGKHYPQVFLCADLSLFDCEHDTTLFTPLEPSNLGTASPMALGLFRVACLIGHFWYWSGINLMEGFGPQTSCSKLSLVSGQLKRTAPMLTPKMCVALIAIRQQFIYCIGGSAEAHGNVVTLNSCEKLIVNSNQWRPIPSPFILIGMDMSCTAIDDHWIYVPRITSEGNGGDSVIAGFVRLDVMDEEMGWSTLQLKGSRCFRVITCVGQCSPSDLILAGETEHVMGQRSIQENTGQLQTITVMIMDRRTLRNVRKVVVGPKPGGCSYPDGHLRVVHGHIYFGICEPTDSGFSYFNQWIFKISLRSPSQSRVISLRQELDAPPS